MNTINNKVLSFSDKMKLIKELEEYYRKTEKFWLYWEKKALVYKLFIKCIEWIKQDFNITRDLTDKEMLDILRAIFTEEYINKIVVKENPIQEAAIKTWIWSIAWIITNDNGMIEFEQSELEKRKWWMTFNTWIFDFYKDK